MKVIFNSEFLENVNLFGNTVTISNYALGKYYREVSNLDEITKLIYLEGDDKKTSNYQIESIWDQEKKLLRLNLSFSSDSIRTKIIENNYEIIYIFYKNMLGLENVAFVLTGDIRFEENFKISKIDLSISKNLIELNILNVRSTINTIMSDDTRFLEGIGINYGYNVLRASSLEEIDSSKLLVPRESYYRYILNNKCSGYSLDIPYLNVLGEKIIDQGESFVSITRIKIWTKNISFDDVIPTDRTLNVDGGDIDLFGEFDYSTYKTNQDGVLEKIESYTKIDIGFLGSYKFEIVNDEGLKIEFDSITRKISFGKNSNPNNNLSTTIRISSNSYNPETKRIEIINSESIKLIQGQAESEWEVIKNTPYSEENIPLYVLDENINSVKSFTIKTNIDFSDIPITITPENELASQFFLFTAEKNIQSGTITVSIKTKENNTKSNIWNPSKTVQPEEGESQIVSELVLINVVVKDRKTSFYCIQKYPVEGMYLYEKISNNNYRKINSVYLPRDSKSKTVYLGKITGNVEDFNFWKYLNNPENENIILSKTNDELNDENPDTWDGILGAGIISSPKSFRIYTSKDYDTVGDTELGEITFQRVKEDQIDKDITYWKDAISVGTLNTVVTLQGQEPSLIIYDSQILTEGLGVYKFYVKSNCSFTGSIQNNSSYARYEFYEDWGDNYDNSSGIPIYIKMYRASYNYQTSQVDVGKITISSNTYPVISKTLKIKINPITASLRKIDPVGGDEEKVFISYSDKLRFFTNKSMNYSTNGNLSYYISSPKFTDSFSKNSEILNYSEFSFNLGSSTKKYPITKLGDLTLASLGSPAETLIYSIYKKGLNPSINMSSGYSNDVYLESPNESYKDVQIKTRYKIITSEIQKINYLGKDFSYIITRGSEDSYGFITYSIRFRALQENTSSSTSSLGSIKIDSRVPADQFITGETYSQNYVDSIAGVDYLYIYIYQKGSGVTDPEISGDTSYVKASGEVRNYSIDSGETALGSVSVDESNELISTSYNSGLKRITATIQDRLNTSSDSSYSPILATNYEEFIKYSKDLTTGFTATIRSTDLNTWTKSIQLVQLGYKYGIIFKSENIDNTIFLSVSKLNQVLLNVPSDSNEVNISLGLFSISSQISEGQEGTNVTIVSEFQENSYEKIKDIPSYNTNNIKLKYQKNTTTAKKSFKYYVSANDSNNENHELTIEVIQGGNSYKLTTENIPNNSPVLFHSSGHCFQNFPDLDVVDNIETDIPLENIKIWSTLPNLTYNITPAGNGVLYPKYKISASINPNQGYSMISGDLYYGYEELGEKIPLWTGKIKQGFLDIQITIPNGNIIRNNGITPIIDSPGKVTGTEEIDRVIFPIKVIQREVNSEGELGEEVLINKNNFGLKGNNKDWIASGYNIDNVFSSYESKYIIDDNKIPSEKIPFIEHQYVVKQGFYATEVLLTIVTLIYANYPDIEEVSPDYRFTFRLKKIKEEDPILNVNKTSENLPTEGGDVTFEVTSNFEDYTVTSDANWLTKKVSAITLSEINKTYTFTATENTGEERIGVITVSGEGIEKTITVTQAGNTTESGG